jgi:hypothetical protein
MDPGQQGGDAQGKIAEHHNRQGGEVDRTFGEAWKLQQRSVLG